MHVCDDYDYGYGYGYDYDYDYAYLQWSRTSLMCEDVLVVWLHSHCYQ